MCHMFRMPLMFNMSQMSSKHGGMLDICDILDMWTMRSIWDMWATWASP